MLSVLASHNARTHLSHLALIVGGVHIHLHGGHVGLLDERDQAVHATMDDLSGLVTALDAQEVHAQLCTWEQSMA